MLARFRKTSLVILAAVLAGHALLTLHVTSHVAADQPACELCTHWSGFDHALAPAAPGAFPLGTAAASPVVPDAAPPATPAPDRRQRGPPLTA
jgi:hypothetical protein